MQVRETLYVVEREDWRQWLSENYKRVSEIWLVYPRKHTGQPRIHYNVAVEEALCFGWIDSITRGIDEDRYSQRFTPRKPRSKYSQTNKERLKRLIAQKRIIPDMLAKIDEADLHHFDFPADIENALRENPIVWENFQRYSPAYQRIRVAFVDNGRKRQGEFEKRLAHLLKMTGQNKQFGFNIEAYY